MKKRILGLVLVLTMLAAFMPCVYAAEIVEEGECGDNIIWTLDSEGTLNISGEGEMSNRSWRSCEEGIKKVIISDGVTNIVEKAFYDCTNMDTVIIPDSVTKIGNAAFNYTAYYDNEANWDNGVLYSGKYVLDAKNSLLNGECEIKDGTVCIADAAFYSCSNMTDIVIPDTIKRIGCQTFKDCAGLTEVTIPKGVTCIDDYAFDGCYNLTKVAMPDSITYIGLSAFGDCSALADVQFPGELEYIGSMAFRKCSVLDKIKLPDNVSHIGRGAFEYTAYYDNEENWKDGVLYIDKHLIKASPQIGGNFGISEGTRCVADSAFELCDVTTVTIPESVIGIGDDSFFLSGITNIFVDERNEYYSSVDGNLFDKEKTALIQYAGEKGTEYAVPDKVTRISEYAFAGDNGLESISVSENNTAYSSQEGVLFNKDKTKLIKYPINKKDAAYKVPSSVSVIGDMAFWYNQNLTELTLPEGLEEIGSAIEDCGNSLRTVFIPKSVESIRRGALPYTISDIYYAGIERRWEWLMQNYRPELEGVQMHYEATEIPDAVIGEFDAPQVSSDAKSVITVPFECIPYNCTVIAAFYSDGVMTGVSSKAAKSTDTSLDFEVNTAADHARVFIWNGAEGLYPVGEAKWDKTH